MLKLVKYEFRKARAALLILFAITAALQGLFQYGLAADNSDALIASIVLLTVCAFGVAVFVLVRGVTTYTAELKSRAGYLTFLTPNSTLKIVGSKFLYTFLNALMAFAIFCGLLFADVSQLLVYLNEYKTAAEFFTTLISSYGIHINEILMYALFYMLYGFLSLLEFVAVAYLATTLSATFFRDKRWSWVVSVVLFIAITWGINRLNGLFLAPLSTVTLVDVEHLMTGTFAPRINVDVWNTILLPAVGTTALISVGVILLSLFGCAYMLEKKVSL